MKCCHLRSNAAKIVLALAILCGMGGYQKITAKAHIDDIYRQATEQLSGSALHDFRAFMEQYESSLDEFLSKDNNDAYVNHLKRIEHSIPMLSALIASAPNTKLKVILKRLLGEIKELNALLASYKGERHSSWGLGLKLAKYHHLMPGHIDRKYSRLTLLNCLGHRLKCNNW